MRYGIIGTGWIAESFIEGARLICNADIAAVYSRTEAKGRAFAEKCDIKTIYTSFDEFAEGDFDAVYIASPNGLHAHQTEIILNHNKHVICEKPITVNPAELAYLQSIASFKNLVYMEAIMYMHNPARKILRDALAEIGNISSAHFDFTQLSSKYDSFMRGENPNIFNPELATGCLMDLGVYCVYPAIDLFGETDKLFSSATFLSSGADGSGCTALNYSDKLVTLTYSKTGQDYSGSVIYGDKGTIQIESISKLTNIDLIDKQGKRQQLIGDVPKAELMGNEAKEFEEFIAGMNIDHYKECSEMSLNVSIMMEQIRKICNIEFGGERLC